MKVLFIGESWLGSCARSLGEALARQNDVDVEVVREDMWSPRPNARWRRALSRLTAPVRRSRFNTHVLERVRATRPDVVMTYKGNLVRSRLIASIRSLGAATVNVYPDCSPHAHGGAHRAAVGSYDLVISTKPFHPALWMQTYRYLNRCVFVSQGYDPLLHLAQRDANTASGSSGLASSTRTSSQRGSSIRAGDGS